MEIPRAGLTHVSPTPEDLADADITTVGATRSQAGAIRALARGVIDGDVRFDAALGIDEFVARLCELPGIGPWTAHYIAMRACSEPDAFPASDLGLRKGASDTSTPLSERELHTMAEAWRPWRSYAAMHLWHRATPTGGAKP